MIKDCNDGIILKIKVIPNSSKTQIILADDIIKIKITAPPVENKANKAVIDFLAKFLKIPKTYITIIKGHTSKDKTIHIAARDENQKVEIKKRFNTNIML